MTEVKILEKIKKGKTKGLVSTSVINETVWVSENYHELQGKVYVP